eukprot:CAMPEP_0185846502 /NCGR_PEP_ID=MMETSP1354-20130828/2105_1 /TAXON_ID=708628 /ORGANISM="Erythrolobus madagascarensis, Strain CCMP3276" /LENGTH=285 /DNA_ID=CAMNT_0028546635 /DNA_START=129 /DNA_END=986 /DNA_ORIENTATION=+
MLSKSENGTGQVREHVSGLLPSSIRAFSNRGPHGYACDFGYECSGVKVMELLQYADGTWRLYGRCVGSSGRECLVTCKGMRGTIRSSLCSCGDHRGKACKHACRVLEDVVDRVLIAAKKLDEEQRRIEQNSVFAVLKAPVIVGEQDGGAEEQEQDDAKVEVVGVFVEREDAELEAKRIAKELNSDVHDENMDEEESQQPDQLLEGLWKTRTLYKWDPKVIAKAKNAALAKSSQQQPAFRVWVEQHVVSDATSKLASTINAADAAAAVAAVAAAGNGNTGVPQPTT